MVSSRLIVEIEGREAVPVRAIPYITGWQISPDALACQLAQKAEFNPLGDVQAFRLVDGVVVAVLPKEWNMIAVSLDRLQGQLKAAYPQVVDEVVHPDYGYAEWQHQSPMKLPADTFVWLSDFEAAFRKAYAKSSPTHVILLDEAPGDRDLVYSPLLPGGISRVDLLGAFAVKTRSNAPIGEGAPGTSRAPDLAKVNSEDGAGHWTEKARAIANELDMRDLHAGAYTSVTEMGDRVAAEMHMHGINGPRGPVSGATVKREALQGSKWIRPRNKKQAGETGETGETTKKA